MKVFVTRMIPKEGLEKLASFVEVTVSPHDRRLSQEEILEMARDCEVLITTVGDLVDKRFMDGLPRLRMVANYAVGYDNIDLDYARSKGVVVTNTPGVLTEATADIAMALILCLARRVVEGDRLVRRGEFKGMYPMYFHGTELQNKTLGVYGMGRIGRALARRARCFGMEVIYHNRRPLDDPEGAQYVSFERLLSLSDFISLNAFLSPETRGRFGLEEFRQMKPTAFLVNTARGPLVKEEELVQALKQGLIAGAGLDVYEFEPRVHPELLTMDNVVLLPHIGSATKEVRARMAVMVADNVLAFWRGQEPPNRVV